jgi:hypothetical protein
MAGAMSVAIQSLEAEGWQAKGSAEYGFVFVQRGVDGTCGSAGLKQQRELRLRTAPLGPSHH